MIDLSGAARGVFTASGIETWPPSRNFRRRPGQRFEPELVEREAQFELRLGVVREEQVATVGGSA